MNSVAKSFEERVMEFSSYINEHEEIKKDIFRQIDDSIDETHFFLDNLLAASIYMVLSQKDYRPFIVAMATIMNEIVDGMDLSNKAVN